ncbi:hypothetical protein MtrunA17_Chr7g0271191 [Medicago truncatula]|uniref:Uncharacterized protein n=1 Tax=Medicago truncatula TaxID=3880 RepID=G7KVJ2_MEDTR|nr:hypothetical protein MTR_7g111210 [Medicago truncatula]RHN49130.1 hypothetical protein MtrunA17_Chr7g0271191 [Medicago truncatula]
MFLTLNLISKLSVPTQAICSVQFQVSLHHLPSLCVATTFAKKAISKGSKGDRKIKLKHNLIHDN